jgi:hypothetical protein
MLAGVHDTRENGRVPRRPLLDERQEAEAERLLKENAWFTRQSMPRRLVIWLSMAATWPSIVVVPLAALAGWNWWLTWLVTLAASGLVYAFPAFWPRRAALMGARQLMSRAEEQRLRELPPPPPGRNL